MTTFTFIDEKYIKLFNLYKNKKIKDHDKLYCFVYMTTNLLNNKIYVGVHTTNNLDDEYIGSGKLFLKAVKKYGKHNFKCEILKYTLTKKHALLIEKSIVNSTFIMESTNYNIKEGGYSRILLTNEGRKNISESNKKRLSKLSKNELSDMMKHVANRDNWSDDKIEKWKNNLSIAVKNSESSKRANKLIYNNLSDDKKKNRNNLISESKKKYYKTLTHEEKVNLLNKATEASKRKIKCEICGKISNTGNYARWHGKNCRKK